MALLHQPTSFYMYMASEDPFLNLTKTKFFMSVRITYNYYTISQLFLQYKKQSETYSYNCY